MAEASQISFLKSQPPVSLGLLEVSQKHIDECPKCLCGGKWALPQKYPPEDPEHRQFQGAQIYVLLLRDCKNNFKKKLIRQYSNI